MATNPALDYGTDIEAITDADDLFSETVGLGVLKQDCIHVLTTDDFLGPGGDGRGFDCRRLIGMPVVNLSAMQPVLSEVLERDDRITSADVVLTATKTNGLDDVLLDVTCHTDAGPFQFTESVLGLTSAAIEGGTE